MTTRPSAYVLCHNPVEADRDRARREQAIERIETELARRKASASARDEYVARRSSARRARAEG